MLEDDITGITLSELTLLLLFIVLAVFYFGSYTSESPSHEDTDTSESPSHEDTERELKQLQDSVKKYQAKISEYQRLLSKKDLRSKQTPTCMEVGITDQFLDTVTIRGADRFEIFGQEHTYTDIKKRYDAELSNAREYGCRHCMKLFVGRGVSLEEYHAALRRLERLFYLKRLGVK